jgi:DNA-binding transcriptional ArsR family regulator
MSAVSAHDRDRAAMDEALRAVADPPRRAILRLLWDYTLGYQITRA